MNLSTYYVLLAVVILVVGALSLALHRSRHREKVQWFGIGWVACTVLSIVVKELT